MEPTTFILTKADIDACPIHSMSVTHYYPDGSCRCHDEPPPVPVDETGGEPPVPYEEDASEAVGPDHVWVEGYTRADGTDVAGHWREVH